MCSVWDVCRLLAWRLCYTLQSRQDSTSHTQQLLPKIKRTRKRHSARVIDVKDASNSHAWQLTNVYICVRQQTTSVLPPLHVSRVCSLFRLHTLLTASRASWLENVSLIHARLLTHKADVFEHTVSDFRPVSKLIDPSKWWLKLGAWWGKVQTAL